MSSPSEVGHRPGLPSELLVNIFSHVYEQHEPIRPLRSTSQSRHFKLQAFFC
jgi:hypothetical protein